MNLDYKILLDIWIEFLKKYERRNIASFVESILIKLSNQMLIDIQMETALSLISRHKSENQTDDQ